MLQMVLSCVGFVGAYQYRAIAEGVRALGLESLLFECLLRLPHLKNLSASLALLVKFAVLFGHIRADHILHLTPTKTTRYRLQLPSLFRRQEFASEVVLLKKC